MPLAARVTGLNFRSAGAIMFAHLSGPEHLEPQTQEFYRATLRALEAGGVPFLLGGAYAFGLYVGINRQTKDLDVFVRPSDHDRALEALAAAGFRTERTFSHWLSKAFSGPDYADIIHSSSNGIVTVDDGWFDHAVEGELLGETILMIPPEEMIWSKAFTMERDRFDGADINHLIQTLGHRLDWDRLLARFGPHSNVLLAHLVLFSFVYPQKRDHLPERVLNRLWQQLYADRDTPVPEGVRLCRGTLLASSQYQTDVHYKGYQDARLQPHGRLTEADAAGWDSSLEHKE
jgi:hypothetical protein